MSKSTLSNVVSSLVQNATILRSQLLNKLFDPRRDIDLECGYPKSLTPDQFRYLYDREGIAQRVVQFWPDESWAMDPSVYETEDPSETAFEREWMTFRKRFNPFHFLHKIDVVSGIGRFGVLLLGLDDGQPLEAPVLSETGTPLGGVELLFLRAFAEDVVEVDSRENDMSNPRFGQPTMYSIKFTDVDSIGDTTVMQTQKVHWSRVIHIADNREGSEVYGKPRMEVAYNRLYDLRKVLGGSGEMFWKGGFPGYAIETDPDIPDVDLDTDSLREQLANHFNGLQRYLALTGVSVKSLAPQVADPKSHVAVLMEQIAITLGVPKRKFIGSEQAQLASAQDDRTWNKRVARRQEKYLTPMVISPFVDRLIALGILPEPTEYTVEWPDLNTVTDQEHAEVAAKRTEAFSKYVAGNVDQLIPPAEYLSMFHGLAQDEVDQIMEAAAERIAEIDAETEADQFVDDEEEEPLDPTEE